MFFVMANHLKTHKVCILYHLDVSVDDVHRIAVIQVVAIVWMCRLDVPSFMQEVIRQCCVVVELFPNCALKPSPKVS